MNLHPIRSFLLLILLISTSVLAQKPATEPVDTAAFSRIVAEATDRSQVMDILEYISEVCGPRLTGSPGFMQAAIWTKEKMTGWGLANAYLEGWGPFGRGWTLERYTAHVIAPLAFPLLSYPKAWSTGTDGPIEGDVIYLDAKTDSALDTYKGKLKGKFILHGGMREARISFEPLATRNTDKELLEMANEDFPKERRPRRAGADNARSLLEYRKLQLYQREGVAALLTPAPFDGGSMMVQSAAVPSHPDTPWSSRIRPWEVRAPRIPPQIAVGAEHYNRLVRMSQRGLRLKMEMNLAVNFTKPDSGYNVIAEIPGSDLADEVVMIGAHLDSWHGGTGATDNGTGVAVCMEVMRILKTLNLKPRRTIRIALWGGEEQGEYGSKAYVKRHFGERVTDPAGSQSIKLTPTGEKFSVYFNDDNGTGKIRGVFLQGNDAVRPIFRKWLDAIDDPLAKTLTLSNTGSTDHQAFDAIGLPGFQFIQDDIEYFNRTWHSTMDLYDRAIEGDLKQTVIIMTMFAYHAAMRDERIPRKPTSMQ